MKLAIRSLLLMMLSGLGWIAYHRNDEPHLGAPPAPIESAFQSEEEWMVGEIVRDIAEMSQFARGGRFEPGAVKATVTRAAAPSDVWTAAVALPGRSAVKVDLPLRTGVWSPAEYEPLARTLMEGLAGKDTPATDETLLATLRDLRAPTIERENQRISEKLKRGMASSNAHEEAALLLGAFALREAAGWFSDHRQTMCRLTAHLAMADALRGGPERSVTGRYADLSRLVISGRTAEALAILDGTDRRPTQSPGQEAWSRALRLRATEDWRSLGLPKSRSLLERLEYYRALANTAVESLALAFVTEGQVEPVADWGRITTGRYVNVVEGNLFFEGALDREQAEIAEVRQVAGAPALSGGPLLAALNEPAARCLGAAGPRVIGWGPWAAFFQRHIAEHVHRLDFHVRRSLSLEEDADSNQARLDRDWGRLVLFPMATCYRIRRQEQNFDRIKDAIDVALSRPELMVAWNWAHLVSGTRYEVLDRGMAKADAWFTTGLPRGTAYDAGKRLEKIATARASDPGVLEAITALNPYDGDIARRRAEALVRRKAPPAEILKALGPRGDYDLAALREVVDGVVERRPGETLEILARMCEIDAEHCLALGFTQAWRKLDDQAAASFQRAIDSPTVDRVNASHPARWLGGYHRKRGRPQKALQIARVAAETGSGGGFIAMAEHWEAVGRFVDAEEYYVQSSDRYKAPKYACHSTLVAFYYRMARVRKEAAFEPRLEKCLASMFPQGLERVDLKTLSGPPTDGVFVNGHNDETLKQGLWAGDVIMGLDGWRVRNSDQYDAVDDFSGLDVIEAMTFTIWRAGAYREVKATFPRRQLYVRLDNYPLKGWVEN